MNYKELSKVVDKANQSTNPEWEDLLREARDPSTSQDRLLELAKLRLPYIIPALTTNRSTPTEALRILAKDRGVVNRMNVAEHPNVDIDILRRFVKSKDPLVAGAVAKSNLLTKDLAEDLLKYPSSPVKRAVLKNPALPADLMEVLIGTLSTPYLEALADNPSIPEDLLTKIAERCILIK